VRLRGKVDANQAAIVRALRQAGYGVLSLASVGNGAPDLLVANTAGGLWLLEVKDGRLPPSRRALTLTERRWHRAWPGPVYVVGSVEAALAVVREER